MKILKYISAFLRIRQKDICAMSTDMGNYDFHDWPDGEDQMPRHFYLHTCKFCGKHFYI